MDFREAQKLDNRSVFRTYKRIPLSLEFGKGPYVYDDRGRRYLDFLTGIGVNALGHCNPRVKKAIADQAGKLSHVSNLYYTGPMLRLADRLTRLAGMKKAFFGNSGAEANEAAFKLVRRYHAEVLGDGRKEFICFNNSFHGRTLANVSATGQDVYRKGFDPLPAGFKHVPFNDPGALEAAVTERTAAIVVEPIQGEAGVYPATRDFMRALSSARRKHGLQLVFDEVQCGAGRTGKWFAYMNYRVKPDVVTVSKPIGGGLPLGIMMARGQVVKGFAPGSHASTFGGSPVACAAANAFIDEIEQRGLLENVADVGGYIFDRLKEMKKTRPAINEIRGKGLMIGIEMSADAGRAAEFMLENGVLVNAIRGSIIRILPPFIITRKHADEFLGVLDEFLSKNRS